MGGGALASSAARASGPPSDTHSDTSDSANRKSFTLDRRGMASPFVYVAVAAAGCAMLSAKPVAQKRSVSERVRRNKERSGANPPPRRALRVSYGKASGPALMLAVI